MLMGARLVIASEVAPGRAWDEPKLKSLTGGDPITARFMRQDFFTLHAAVHAAGRRQPQAGFQSVDEAIRRRVQLVPFLQNIPKAERDPDLGEKLKAEAPAILRWVIDGCLAWQRQGLNPPKSVREASESYLDGEDILGQWLAERCELGGTRPDALRCAVLRLEDLGRGQRRPGLGRQDVLQGSGRTRVSARTRAAACAASGASSCAKKRPKRTSRTPATSAGRASCERLAASRGRLGHLGHFGPYRPYRAFFLYP